MAFVERITDTEILVVRINRYCHLQNFYGHEKDHVTVIEKRKTSLPRSFTTDNGSHVQLPPAELVHV